MINSIEYQHWLVFGMLLMGAEIFVPSFTIFWFGLGGITVGLLLLAFPFSLNVQIVSWALLSSFYAFLWFKYLKKLMPDRTKAGVSREAIIGESGQVIKPQGKDGQHGLVRFTIPVMGDDEWSFICEQPTQNGDKVFIKEISGNTLIVEKRS